MKNISYKTNIILGTILIILLCGGAIAGNTIEDSDWFHVKWTETNLHLGVIADELELQNKIRQCELTWTQISENTVVECVVNSRNEVYRR